MKALVKNNEVIAIGQNEKELAPEYEFFGGIIVDVITLELPKDHLLAGEINYVYDGNVVKQMAKTEYAYTNYAEARKLHYPPIEDYIDGIVKNDQLQIDAYIASCLQVKARFPKP